MRELIIMVYRMYYATLLLKLQCLPLLFSLGTPYLYELPRSALMDAATK